MELHHPTTIEITNVILLCPLSTLLIIWGKFPNPKGFLPNRIFFLKICIGQAKAKQPFVTHFTTETRKTPRKPFKTPRTQCLRSLNLFAVGRLFPSLGLTRQNSSISVVKIALRAVQLSLFFLCVAKHKRGISHHPPTPQKRFFEPETKPPRPHNNSGCSYFCRGWYVFLCAQRPL